MGDNSNTSMTSDDSSDSESNSLSNYLPPSAGSHRPSKGTKNARRIAGSLKDTTDALQDVDRMLGQYQSIASAQASSINKLKDKISGSSRRARRSSVSSLRSSDLEHSSRDRGRRTYRPTSPLRDYQYASDQEYRSSRRSRRRPRSAVRFEDDVRVDREHLHDIHKSVRDLSADHERLETELEREIRNRYRRDREQERSLSELNSSVRMGGSMKPPPSIEHVERRLERKLENMATKIENRQKSEGDGGSAGISAAALSKSLTDALRASQTNLASALPPQPTIDVSTQHKVSELETDKRRLQHELDLHKQKLDQGEGARRALTMQVDDLRCKLREVDDERHRALRLAEEFKDSEKRARKKQRDMTRVSEDEHQRLQMEIQDLKVQLSHTISREELEVMRRELQKTEKQKAQLADHVEALSKDMRVKEHSASSLHSEITELTNTKSKLEADNSKLQTELERERENVRVQDEKSRKMTTELSVLQSEFELSTKHKEDMKARATEVVKLWKAKCKALQREADDLRAVGTEHAGRGDQLSVENDSLRTQLSAVTNQMDKLTKEMADLLTSNQNYEDKLRSQQGECKDLRKVKGELERANHEQTLQLQQYERDIRKMNDQFINYEAESAQLSDKLAATKDQLESVEQQHRLVKSQHADAQAELAKKAQQVKDRESDVQDLETKLMTCEASESACRRELEMLHCQLNRQQEAHEKTAKDLLTKVDKLKKELSEVKAREVKTGEEYHRRFKHLQADKDAQVESMKVDLEEAHLSVQNVKRQAKSQGDEYLRLEHKYRQLEEEFSAYKQQTKRLKEQTDDLREMGDHQDERCKELESSLSTTRHELTKLEQQYAVLSQAVRTELQVLVETAEAAADLKYSEPDSAGDVLTDIASKTTWIRRYIRTAQDVERQLRMEMKTRLSEETSEKSELMTEIKRQKKMMDELGGKHRSLVEDMMAREEEVVKLEDKLTELSFQVEEQKALDDAVEKTKILERYQRLQSAVSSLKQELRSSSAHAADAADSLDSKDSKNSLRQRQVRISEIVSSNDGTRSFLKQSSPPDQDTCVDPDLQERISAYSRALGPNSYRGLLDDDVEEVQGTYINELDDSRVASPDLPPHDNYRNSGSHRKSGSKRHATPHKTMAMKS